MNLALDPGPFAPVVGYVAAILSAVYIIWSLAWGKKIWDTPQNILPREIRGLIGIALGVCMVAIWLTTTTENSYERMSYAVYSILIAIISYLGYYSIIKGFTYFVVHAIGPQETNEEKILGGLWLRKNAKESKAQNNVRTNQALLKGAAYDSDELWSRSSQTMAKLLVIFFYIATVSFGMLGIITAGLSTQVRLTGKVPTEVIKKSDSPGLNESTESPTQKYMTHKDSNQRD